MTIQKTNKFLLVLFDDAIESTFELETFFKIPNVQIRLVIKLPPTSENIALANQEYKNYLKGKPIISLHFQQSVPTLPPPDGVLFSSEDYQKGLEFALAHPVIKVWIKSAEYFIETKNEPKNFSVVTIEFLSSYLKQYLKKNF